MKRFTKRNEGFRCLVCGHQNPPAQGTCRDHCQKCLWSQHVDCNPGDRACTCLGLLEPIGIETKGGEMIAILYQCQKCGYAHKNRLCGDDDRSIALDIFGRMNQRCEQKK